MRLANISPFCLLILLQSILYGLGDPLSKAAYEAMPVYSLLSVRYLIGLLVLLLLAGRRIRAGLRQCSPRDWLLPSLCVAGCYILNNVALGLTEATAVAFIRSLSTVMTPVLALVAYRTRYSWQHIPIQAMIVVGLYLLCGLGGMSGFGPGEVLALLSALMMAGSLVFGGYALVKMDALTLSAVQTAVSAAVVMLCACLCDGGICLDGATPAIWAVIVYLAVGCTVAGYLLQNIALEKLSAGTVALLQCSCPVMTALFSYLILDERLSAAGMLGALIILVCVVAETWLDQRIRCSSNA